MTLIFLSQKKKPYMFLGKPSLRILLCRKDLPLAWLSSLQVPPMQPRRQQLPASQPRSPETETQPDPIAPPADRQERRADRRAEGTRWWSQRLVSPPTHGAVMQRRDVTAQTCSGMKRPGLWVVVKLYVWCLQLFLTWLPHTVTILSKLIGSKKKKKEKKYVPNYHLQTFLTRIFFPCWGQSVNLNCDKSSRGSKYTTAAEEKVLIWFLWLNLTSCWGGRKMN